MVKDDNLLFEKYIEHSTIQEHLKSLKDIKPDIMLGILKGCNPFMSDLLKVIEKKDVIVDYCRLSSYRGGLIPGKLEFLIEPEYSLYEGNCKVYIVDDIIDRGGTIKVVSEKLLNYNPDLNIEVVTLLKSVHAPDILNVNGKDIKVTSLITTDAFVIGYGLDYKEKFRGLTDICKLVD